MDGSGAVRLGIEWYGSAVGEGIGKSGRGNQR